MTTKTNSSLSVASERVLGALPPSPRTILVAGGEEPFGAEIAATLASLGYGVHGPVVSLRAGLDLANEKRPDMAVVGACLSWPDGMVLAETIGREMHVPTLLVGSVCEPALLETAAKAGVLGYLIKPVSEVQFGVALPTLWARHLRERRLTLEAQDAQAKLEQRKLVERAKGLLMKEKGIGEEEAMRALQKQARDGRRPMAEVAKEIIAAAEAARPSAAPQDPPPSV
ncbi:MAG: ANTAR domain-containing protein [Planctomycetota bacterium]|nr:ANTAR domain-containing protein [Planctomycetota bacterium]